MKNIDLSKLLKDKKLNTYQSAKLMIQDSIEEKKTGKGFLSQDEKYTIRDNKDMDGKYYNRLIDLDTDLKNMMVNVNLLYLNYKLVYSGLKSLFLDFLIAIRNIKTLKNSIDYFKKHIKGSFNKDFEEIESDVKMSLIFSGGLVYCNLDKEKTKLEDLRNIDIMPFKEKITNYINELKEGYQNLLM